jgi:hypothetical protein
MYSAQLEADKLKQDDLILDNARLDPELLTYTMNKEHGVRLKKDHETSQYK